MTALAFMILGTEPFWRWPLRYVSVSWVTRRIAGFLTFTIVAAILGSVAALRGWLVGGLSLATATGAAILGIAFLSSLAVTSNMKRRDEYRKAWEANELAWQDYYARLSAYSRRR